MRIGIDARFLGPLGTGIGRYVENLLNNLEKIDKDNFYIIFLKKDNWHLYNPQAPNFSKTLADASWYTLREQAILPLILRKASLDLLHVPHFNIPLAYRGKLVVTIHDLIKSEFKNQSSTTHLHLVYKIKHKAYEKVIKIAVNRASRIITPSSYVKQKLILELHVPAEKIAVTYEAADPKFFEWHKVSLREGVIRQIHYKYNIKPPFLLYVGNAFPYKNIDRLLEAMKFLPSEIKLINPCVRTVFYEKLASEVHRLDLEHRVVLPGFVPDEDLAVLYKTASAYVFPSLSEGFGLPAIEAMASGTPVVCSGIPVLKEVCGEAAYYFDPYDSKSMVESIEKVLNDKKIREGLIKKGNLRAQNFSWEKTAKQTLEIYKEV